jgi:hypothetical protein
MDAIDGGAVDRGLEAEGRLVLITTAEEVRTAIPLIKRGKDAQPDRHPRPALEDIIGHLESIMDAEFGRPDARAAV